MAGFCAKGDRCDHRHTPALYGTRKGDSEMMKKVKALEEELKLLKDK
jgi:hypothetical protein